MKEGECMDYDIKKKKQDVDRLISFFLGFGHLSDIIESALQGHGYGFEDITLFLSGDDWDEYEQEYFFPHPIEESQCVLMSTGWEYVCLTDRAEIAYVPLEVLYKYFEKAVKRDIKKGVDRHNQPQTLEYQTNLRRDLSKLKEKWNLVDTTHVSCWDKWKMWFKRE